jgi:hypothetical protein
MPPRWPLPGHRTIGQSQRSPLRGLREGGTNGDINVEYNLVHKFRDPGQAGNLFEVHQGGSCHCLAGPSRAAVRQTEKVLDRSRWKSALPAGGTRKPTRAREGPEAPPRKKAGHGQAPGAAKQGDLFADGWIETGKWRIYDPRSKAIINTESYRFTLEEVGAWLVKGE